MKKTFLNSTFAILLVFAIFLALVFLKANFTFSKISVNSQGSGHELPVYLLPELGDLPKPNNAQLNILLLGQRGEGEPFGGLLTDSLILVSLNKNKGIVSLISIPRDLYVPMPNSSQRDKINAVYAWGYEHGGIAKGIRYIKDTVSRVTGLYVDNVVIVNFKAFEEFIDALGGIDVYLKNDFLENKQWWCDEHGRNCKSFFLPKGKNHLDGRTALFYVRSRFSSSDFDRARRQQQVLLAIKRKAFSLGFLTNPANVLKFLTLLGDNVRTDMSRTRMMQLFSYFKDGKFNLDNIRMFVFDDSPQGFLYAKHLNGRYILLPRTGDFKAIQRKCLEITN